MAHRHPTVLIVNDHQDISDAMGVLIDDRYTVATAQNGAEALRMLRGGLHPCIILLDLMMPVMDGVEFRAEQLRDPELAGIPVVVFSAVGDLHAAAGRLNASAYVRIPDDVLRLIELLDEHCLK